MLTSHGHNPVGHADYLSSQRYKQRGEYDYKRGENVGVITGPKGTGHYTGWDPIDKQNILKQSESAAYLGVKASFPAGPGPYQQYTSMHKHVAYPAPATLSKELQNPRSEEHHDERAIQPDYSTQGHMLTKVGIQNLGRVVNDYNDNNDAPMLNKEQPRINLNSIEYENGYLDKDYRTTRFRRKPIYGDDEPGKYGVKGWPQTKKDASFLLTNKKYVDDSLKQVGTYIYSSKNNFTAGGTENFNKIMSQSMNTIDPKTKIIATGPGAPEKKFEKNPADDAVPALYSTRNYGDELRDGCCSECTGPKVYNKHRQTYDAKREYKDHPVFHSYLTYQTCSCHINGKDEKKVGYYKQLMTRNKPEGPEVKFKDTYLDFMKGGKPTFSRNKYGIGGGLTEENLDEMPERVYLYKYDFLDPKHNELMPDHTPWEGRSLTTGAPDIHDVTRMSTVERIKTMESCAHTAQENEMALETARNTAINTAMKSNPIVITSDGSSNYYNTQGITDDQLQTANSGLQGGKDGVDPDKPSWAKGTANTTSHTPRKTPNGINTGDGSHTARETGSRLDPITTRQTQVLGVGDPGAGYDASRLVGTPDQGVGGGGPPTAPNIDYGNMPASQLTTDKRAYINNDAGKDTINTVPNTTFSIDKKQNYHTHVKTLGHDSAMLSHAAQSGLHFQDNVIQKTPKGATIIASKLKNHEGSTVQTQKLAFAHSMANEHLYRHDFASQFMLIYGEILIRYNMSALHIDKFNLAAKLPVYECSYSQINEHKMFICGGIVRGTRQTFSEFAGIFDCSTNTLYNVTNMSVPRYRHTLACVGDFIYVLGGATPTNSITNLVERYEIGQRSWAKCEKMNFPRTLSKAVVTYNVNCIYVMGGCEKMEDNYFIERYDVHNNHWAILRIKLTEPFRTLHSFTVLIEGGIHLQSLNEYMHSDQDDKLLVFNYGNIRYPSPTIQMINLGMEEVKELYYDKDGSEMTSFEKKEILWDERSQMILAFSNLNFHEFDYIALTTEPLRWRKSKFLSDSQV